MTRFNPYLLSALALVVAAPQIAAANPTFDFYGQLNFGLFDVDDGTESETFFTDNDNSNSRLGLWYSNDLAGGATVKFNFEFSLGFEGSSAATMDDHDASIDLGRSDLRKLEVIYETPTLGKLSFGQGGTATDGTAEADFSGTSVIAYVGIADLAGSFEFRPNGGALSGIAISDTFKSFDGARRFRLRFDTPSWNGLVFSVSGGEEVIDQDNEDEFYDLAGKYTADYGDVKIDSRLGYSWVSGGNGRLLGSIAGLHEPTGLSLALSAAEEQDDSDAAFYYVKLGYQQDWFAAGKTAVSIDYYDGSDFEVDGSDSSSMGIAVVQSIDAYALELYAAYRAHEFDAPGTDFEDIDSFAIGARWKF
ncbi:MAG: porin [Roseobacter sp.]|jgi:hypothetical protein|nr:porin [Roseobacter sp.]